MKTAQMIMAIAVVTLVCLSTSSFLAIPTKAGSGPVPGPPGYWDCMWPSSTNASSSWHKYRGSEPPISEGSGTSIGSVFLNDGLSQSILQYSGASWYTVQTGHFDNPVYYGTSAMGPNTTNVEGGYYDLAYGGMPIWDNGTVERIWLNVVFKNHAVINTDDFSLQLSTDGGGSFRSGGLGSSWAYTMLWQPSYWVNVTTWKTWTPAMIKSPDTVVRAVIFPPVGVDYSIDYLGFIYEWYAPGHWIPTWTDPSNVTVLPPPIIGPNLDFSTPSPLGMIGIIGFVGMIGVPVAGIWMAKRSDQPKLIFGLQIMIAFVVCLGLFLASIS